MVTVNIYCRLCAEIKPCNKQVDLQSDPEKRNEIFQKLTRINATTKFFDNELPSTVCRECLSSLNKCFIFVVNIERAQKILVDMLAQQNVKHEKDKESQIEQWKIEQQSDDEDSLLKVDHYDSGSGVPLPTGLSDDAGKVSLLYMKLEHRSENVVPKDMSDGKSSDGHVKPTDIYMKHKCIDIDIDKPSKFKKVNKNLKSDSFNSTAISQLTKTWAEYNWRCTYCESQFPSIEELQSHSQAAHSACNPYRCSDCNFRKGRLDKFLNHVKSHHSEFKNSCYKCFQKFKSKIEARRHKSIHNNTKFSCPGCKATFMNSVQQKLHSDTYYQVKKKVIDLPQPQMSIMVGLTCTKCSRSFKTKGNLKCHVIKMHTERKLNYVCETCGKSFLDKSTLAQHMQIHRTDRPHKCHVCKLGFKTIPVLKDHISRHSDDRPFSCEQCGSSFRLQRDLTKHIGIHSDTLPFQCRYCVKRFRRAQYRTNHERLHTGEKPYACLACHHTFSDWPNYNKHMKQRHNQNMAKRKAFSLTETNSLPDIIINK